jgi:N-acyl-D-amino-acid deacylase
MTPMRQALRWLLLAVAVTTLQSATAPQPQPFDVLIQNGRVMDGSGKPWMRADVAIRSGRIVAIGHLRDATASKRI